MAFFPRNYYGAEPASFTPLFRLLDDFDNFARQSQGYQNRNHVPSFQPKFDVREVEDAYELHGELSGMKKEDVQIQFTDPHTLHIRGRIERSYTSGTPPRGLIQDTKMSGAITESGEQQQQEESTPKKDTAHQATVEEDDGAETTGSNTAQATPATTVAEVAKNNDDGAKTVAPANQQKRDTAKYWVSERSIGEFSRSFHFPGQIKQDAVTANLQDGILTIRVPKAPKHEARTISIN